MTILLMMIIILIIIERGLSNPATPAPTPNSSAPLHHHSLHPDAILAGISSIGGDEGNFRNIKGLVSIAIILLSLILLP